MIDYLHIKTFFGRILFFCSRRRRRQSKIFQTPSALNIKKGVLSAKS
jgi:hypothetical protein